MKDAKNKENAQKVAEMLNSFTFDYEGFCKAMSNEHRTLQQSFTRLCIHWLCTCASDVRCPPVRQSQETVQN